MPNKIDLKQKHEILSLAQCKRKLLPVLRKKNAENAFCKNLVGHVFVMTHKYYILKDSDLTWTPHFMKSFSEARYKFYMLVTAILLPFLHDVVVFKIVLEWPNS